MANEVPLVMTRDCSIKLNVYEIYVMRLVAEAGQFEWITADAQFNLNGYIAHGSLRSNG